MKILLSRNEYEAKLLLCIDLQEENRKTLEIEKNKEIDRLNKKINDLETNNYKSKMKILQLKRQLRNR